MDEAAITGYGGKREGAGQKPRSYVEANPAIAAYNSARARKESALADGRELDFKVRAGEFVSRAAIRQGSATALSALCQTLRGVPDALERKRGIAPEIAQAVSDEIDAALLALSVEFQALCED